MTHTHPSNPRDTCGPPAPADGAAPSLSVFKIECVFDLEIRFIVSRDTHVRDMSPFLSSGMRVEEESIIVSFNEDSNLVDT